MTRYITPGSIGFITQRPREDGCGCVTLQMLTGKTYAELAPHFGWSVEDLRRTDWANLRDVLYAIGWQLSPVTPVTGWDEILDLAIVHVMEDHFMLYDGRSMTFYDPWELEGPQKVTNRVPMSFATVTPPAG
jgi:hypothetical protein